MLCAFILREPLVRENILFIASANKSIILKMIKERRGIMSWTTIFGWFAVLLLERVVFVIARDGDQLILEIPPAKHLRSSVCPASYAKSPKARTRTGTDALLICSRMIAAVSFALDVPFFLVGHHVISPAASSMPIFEPVCE